MGRHTALSRKSCCSFESGFLRLAFDALSRDSGCGSEDGGAEEVVIAACCARRDGGQAELGNRKS